VSAVGSFPVPGKLYFKQGSLPIALRELTDVYHASRVLILADEEMLHNGSLAALTGALYDLGIDYAVNQTTFAADALLVYTGFADYAQWDALPETIPHILIPASVTALTACVWQKAEMLIADEDLIVYDFDPTGVRNRIYDNVSAALILGNASDYTLAWAVQALRMAFRNDDSKTTLLHAFLLAELASLAARAEGQPDEDLFAEAAEALGMTETELKERIRS
jgi:hypothetical protein